MSLVPPDYRAARRAFREAAEARGAALESHAPSGDCDLSTDVARIGPSAAGRVLVVLSGTHGNEGLAGSAIQLDLLARLDVLFAAHGGLPPDFALVLVHAINPWGMAHLRRQNAANVDLNRNFRDWSRPPPARPVYRALHPLLVPETMDAATEAAFLARATALLEDHGEAWLAARLTEGQYEEPDGLYWGGGGPAAESQIACAILARHLEGAREALLVDCHTGMGAFGDWLVLAGAAADSAEGAFLARAFAPQRLRFQTGGAAGPGDAAPRIEGRMTAAIARAHPGVAVRGFSLEFGTAPARDIFLAERREQWAWARLGTDHPERAEAARALHRLLVPEDPLWQARLIDGARACLADGLRALVGEGAPR